MPLRGGGVGKPGFPTPSPRAYVHVSECGCAAPRRDENRLFLGGLRPPKPSRGRGRGDTRFPHPPARGRRPYLPAGGGVGTPGFPIPLRKGGALTFPRAGEWRHPVSPSPCARAAPSPSRGRGREDTRFPHAPRRGRMFTSGRVVGRSRDRCSVHWLDKVALRPGLRYGLVQPTGALRRPPAGE